MTEPPGCKSKHPERIFSVKFSGFFPDIPPMGILPAEGPKAPRRKPLADSRLAVYLHTFTRILRIVIID